MVDSQSLATFPYKAKRLLAILAEQSPYTLNIAALSKTLQVSQENVLKLLDLMDKSALVRKLYTQSGGMKMLVKPEKILFDNPNIMYALSNHVDAGTMRETTFASQLSVGHQLHMSIQGNIVVDDTYTFEVGGRSQGYTQIRNLDSSYVVRDGIELGIDTKSPSGSSPASIKLFFSSKKHKVECRKTTIG